MHETIIQYSEDVPYWCSRMSSDELNSEQVTRQLLKEYSGFYLATVYRLRTKKVFGQKYCGQFSHTCRG